MSDEKTTTPAFDVFTVIERKKQDDWWVKIGAAWPTKSGEGFTIQLHSLPLDGRLTLLPYKPRDAPKD
jgi:hypothetical protein